MTPSDDTAGEMNEAEIIGGLLVPSDQDRAEAVKPGMRSLHHPAPCLGPGVALGLDFLAPGLQVQSKAEFFGQSPWLGIIVALIETKMVRSMPCRSRPLNWKCLDGLAHQHVVVAVGGVDHRRQRHAAAIRQHRAFDPAFAAIRWIAAGFFPPKGALPMVPSSASQVQSIPLSLS